MSETYKAICARADVYSHPDADRLRIAKVCGYQTITSTPVETGDLVVFFPADGQISHEFLATNNEYRAKLGMNQSPAHNGGFFEENRRVSTIRLRGQVSEGYIVRPEAFAYTGADLSLLTEGFVFDQLNGHEICNKYMTRATRQAGQPKPQKAKIKPRQVSRMFKEHVDTSQLRYYPNRVTPGSTVIITSKLHGCVSAETLVDTLEYGTLPIKTIVDQKLPGHIKSLNTFSKEIEYALISDWYYLRNDGDWYEIELEDGRIIQITGNNPVWLPELNCYRPAEQLKENDVLLVD